jgi:hypothetical protein
MKPHFRLVCCLAGLLLVGIGVGCPYLREAFKVVNEQYDAAGSWREWQSARRRSEELDAQRERLRHWQEGKREAVRAVIAGRMTLLEAAARFRELDRQLPEFKWDLFRRAYPGSSDGERHCRHVIAATEAELSKRPDEAAEVMARLEAELQEHLQRDGTIQLPELPR